MRIWSQCTSASRVCQTLPGRLSFVFSIRKKFVEKRDLKKIAPSDHSQGFPSQELVHQSSHDVRGTGSTIEQVRAAAERLLQRLLNLTAFFRPPGLFSSQRWLLSHAIKHVNLPVAFVSTLETSVAYVASAAQRVFIPGNFYRMDFLLQPAARKVTSFQMKTQLSSDIPD